jgi:hypothetical protein
VDVVVEVESKGNFKLRERGVLKRALELHELPSFSWVVKGGLDYLLFGGWLDWTTFFFVDGRISPATFVQLPSERR